MKSPLRISEARKRLSRLVEGVAQGGGPIAIGRYGHERAVLLSAEEYARLKTSRSRATPTLVGTLSLACSPQDLVAESHRLGELWLAAFENQPPSRRPRRRSRAR